MKTLTTAAKAAIAIRKVLKEKFPTVKFGVTAKNYSMGNSVSISWTDGPRECHVENEIWQFEQGHFDGMTDSYEFSNRRDDIPQVKFVKTLRSMSKTVESEIVASLPVTDDSGYDTDRRVWRAFSSNTYTAIQ